MNGNLLQGVEVNGEIHYTRPGASSEFPDVIRRGNEFILGHRYGEIEASGLAALEKYAASTNSDIRINAGRSFLQPEAITPQTLTLTDDMALKLSNDSRISFRDVGIEYSFYHYGATGGLDTGQHGWLHLSDDKIRIMGRGDAAQSQGEILDIPSAPSESFRKELESHIRESTARMNSGYQAQLEAILPYANHPAVQAARNADGVSPFSTLASTLNSLKGFDAKTYLAEMENNPALLCAAHIAHNENRRSGSGNTRMDPAFLHALQQAGSEQAPQRATQPEATRAVEEATPARMATPEPAAVVVPPAPAAAVQANTPKPAPVSQIKAAVPQVKETAPAPEVPKQEQAPAPQVPQPAEPEKTAPIPQQQTASWSYTSNPFSPVAVDNSLAGLPSADTTRIDLVTAKPEAPAVTTPQAPPAPDITRINVITGNETSPDHTDDLIARVGAKGTDGLLYRGVHNTNPDSRSAVEQLQRDLKEQGLYQGEVDGQFGPQTHAAVQKFQRDNGLEDSGIAGKETVAALQIVQVQNAQNQQKETNEVAAAMQNFAGMVPDSIKQMLGNANLTYDANSKDVVLASVANNSQNMGASAGRG